MDWASTFAPQITGGPSAQQSQGPNDFIGQQADIARQQYMANALRNDMTAYSGGGQGNQGMMVGGRYIPNYGAMGQQIIGGMYSGGADRQLQAEQVGMQRAQLGAAQQAIQQAPQRFAPNQVDENGNPVPQTDAQGNPVTQSFPEYKKQMGIYASQLMQNPLTAQMGMKLATEISDGTMDQAEQQRIDKLQMAKEAQETKRTNAALMAQNRLDVVGAQQAGATARTNTMAQVRLATQGITAPANQLKYTNTLTNAAEKELKPFTTQIDEVNAFNDVYNNTLKTGNISPADSAALIDRFQKTVNPGASVKDSQYYRIMKMNPGLESLRLQVEGWKNGNVSLTPETAKMLNDTLQQYTKDARQNMYNVSNQYADMAQTYGLDPNKIIKVENYRDPSRGDLYEYKPLDKKFDTIQGDGTSGSTAPVNDGKGNTTIINGGQPMPTSYKDPKWDDLEKQISPQYADALHDIRMKGEASNSDQVSSAGARTPYQVTPATRDLIMQKYGYDAYASPENAVRAAAQVYQDGLAKSGGNKVGAVNHYNGNGGGNTPTKYSNSVLTKTQEEKKAQAQKTLPITSSPVAPAPSGQTGGWSMVTE